MSIMHNRISYRYTSECESTLWLITLVEFVRGSLCLREVDSKGLQYQWRLEFSLPFLECKMSAAQNEWTTGLTGQVSLKRKGIFFGLRAHSTYATRACDVIYFSSSSKSLTTMSTAVLANLLRHSENRWIN